MTVRVAVDDRRRHLRRPSIFADDGPLLGTGGPRTALEGPRALAPQDQGSGVTAVAPPRDSPGTVTHDDMIHRR